MIEFSKVWPAQQVYENKWLEEELMKGSVHQHSNEELATHLVNHQLGGSTQKTNKHKHIKEPKTAYSSRTTAVFAAFVFSCK